MVNSQVIKEITEALKLDLNAENIPAAIPVIEVGVKHCKPGMRANLTRTTTGGTNFMTAPTDQDLFITGVYLTVVKDSTCDTADGAAFISVVQGGVSITIAAIPLLTLTAQENTLNFNFGDHPIKVDRGSALALGSNTFTAGKLIRCGLISYYLDEVN